MLKEIAISGMKGRKRDSLILISVILLSFIFIILATSLYSSSQRTRELEAEKMFGSWEYSILGLKEEIDRTSEVETFGSSQLVGYSPRLGYIGSSNEEFFKMANFNLYEGDFPKEDNEVLIELGQVSKFKEDLRPGDRITVDIQIPIISLSEEEGEALQMARVLEDLRSKDDLKDQAYSKNLDYIEKALDESDYAKAWSSLYGLGMDRNIRNERSLEVIGDTKLIVESSYIYNFIRDLGESQETNIDRIKRDGTLYKKTVSLSRDMVVAGIIENYTNLWDLGPNPSINTFITDRASQAFIEEGLLLSEEIGDFSYGKTYNYFLKGEEDKLVAAYGPLVEKNKNLGYKEDSAEKNLTYSILAFIFIGTSLALFQIYLSQMKRRTRRIGLLKSIGASNGQIRRILAYELAYILKRVLVLSLILGLGLSRLALLFMNLYTKGDLIFHINPRLLGLGILLGLVSVLIGVTIPLYKSMKLPLRGEISPPARKKKGHKKHKDTGLDIGIQSPGGIFLRALSYNKETFILRLGLYSLTISTLLVSLLLSYLSFGDYRDKVLARRMPSYSFDINHGIRARDMEDVYKSLILIDGVEEVEILKYGEGAYLYYDEISENPINKSFKDLLPSGLEKEHFGRAKEYSNIGLDEAWLVDDGLRVSVYGIDPEGQVFKKLNQALEEEIDQEAFKKGEELILFLPNYLEKEAETGSKLDDILPGTNKKNRMSRLLSQLGPYDLSYDFRDQGLYKSQEGPEKIHLTIPTEEAEGERKTMEVRTHELKIGGIFRNFKEDGLWPISGNIEGPIVMTSYNFLTDLYPASLSGRRNLSERELEDLINSIYPTRFGRSWINIYEKKSKDQVKTQVDLQRFGHDRGYRLISYKEDINRLLSRAISLSAIFLILGGAMAGLAIIILYNSSKASMDQERERIGILQSIGMREKDFKRVYFRTGLVYGLGSLLIGHLLLGLIVLTRASLRGPGLSNNIRGLFWLYPYKIHLAISLVFLLLAVLSYYLPLRKILTSQPVENIRSLN